MINQDYNYTSIFSKSEDFKPDKHSSYFYGYSMEKRSHWIDHVITNKIHDLNFVRIIEVDDETITDETKNSEFKLKSAAAIQGFLNSHSSETIYIDVTGLDNRICASLINNAFKCLSNTIIKHIKIIYVEPLSYDIKQFTSEGVFNDLSEKIEGIKPLPGFASIIPTDTEDVPFIALLGFEGGRFTHLLEAIQPSKDNVIPVIGVPGYRAEYPFLAYWGNRRPLEELDTWRKIIFAAANSLVDIYLLLNDLKNKNPNGKIKLAPIGTKPHAIGAILFAIKYPQIVELIYDNPLRKKQRTDGIGNIVECFVSKLLMEN